MILEGKSRKLIRIFQNETYKKLEDLYGIFFEDINHAADGGLYPELVQNRSFEYCKADREGYHALTAWQKSAGLDWEVKTEAPLNKHNSHYLSLKGKTGNRIRNLGYNTGIHVEDGKEYDFSLFARTKTAEDAVCLRVLVEDDECTVFAEAKFCVQGTEWKKYELSLKAKETTDCGILNLVLENDAQIDLDMVSLFPKDTFKGRKNGLRRDIAQALADLKPKFMRFPGGCLVHDGSLNGHDRNSMYRWKRTLGKIEERPTWRNNWHYNQTLGLGFYEYFCFCEDIGAKPLPVLPGGFNPHKGIGVPLSEIGEWVKDALDLIEFANGSDETKWGKIRAQLGHPEPFYLEYIAIGNEEIGEGFFERYPYFHQAIREKYPEIKIINTAGPFAVGEGYEDGWRNAWKYGSDFVDEHYYAAPEWFLANMHHYEDYDENGPKVFLGEYASWGNTYYNAIVEAAYMTHLERAKAVKLACYAPLLCNADYVNWKPDLLWFNNHAIVKTPNYYVQKLFMEFQGTDEIRFETENLDEVIVLTDQKYITGDLTIAGNDIAGKIWDIRIEDYTAETVTELSAFAVNPDNQVQKLCHINSEHYALSFRFKRSSGRKGLKISFGRQDEKNQFFWEFGGWDNWDCNLNSAYHGRNSTISHRIFHVEDTEYFLKLEVNRRAVKTYVNGELYNNVTDHLPELEELYIAASCDKENGKTILKAVNLTGEEKKTEIWLDGAEKRRVTAYMLKGYGLTDQNTFEDPEHIVPVTESQDFCANMICYTFEPHSVTVLVFE